MHSSISKIDFTSRLDNLLTRKNELLLIKKTQTKYTLRHNSIFLTFSTPFIFLTFKESTQNQTELIITLRPQKGAIILLLLIYSFLFAASLIFLYDGIINSKGINSIAILMACSMVIITHLRWCQMFFEFTNNLKQSLQKEVELSS